MDSALATLKELNPAFWTFAAAIMTGMMTALVTLSGSRRAARAAEKAAEQTSRSTERKDELTADQELRASVFAGLKMFNDNMLAVLASERQERAAERAAMALDLKDLRRRINAAVAHIVSLERRIIALGEAPPSRPEGVD